MSPGSATPIFDALVAETGVQWPGPHADDEPGASPVREHGGHPVGED
ncbi:hypothetical protein [Amycolatopsis sp. NPDC098790]